MGCPRCRSPAPVLVPPLSQRAPSAVMAEGSGSGGSGRGPPCLGAASAFRRWEQLRRRAATPWARGLLAAAAGLGLLYAVLRVPVRLRDGLAAGEGGRGGWRRGEADPACGAGRSGRAGSARPSRASWAVSGIVYPAGPGQWLSLWAGCWRAAPQGLCPALGPSPHGERSGAGVCPEKETNLGKIWDTRSH